MSAARRDGRVWRPATDDRRNPSGAFLLYRIGAGAISAMLVSAGPTFGFHRSLCRLTCASSSIAITCGTTPPLSHCAKEAIKESSIGFRFGLKILACHLTQPGKRRGSCHPCPFQARVTNQNGPMPYARIAELNLQLPNTFLFIWSGRAAFALYYPLQPDV